MKGLREFILEELEPVVLKDLKVVYDCTKDHLSLSVPEGYSENDMQIYMQDRLLKDFPSDPEHAERFFGKNAANIDDAYFEYKSFSKAGKDSFNGEVDIEWDSQYDESKKDSKLAVFTLNKLSYTILFSEFELMSSSSGEDTKRLVEKVFKATESSDLNKYAVGIKFNLSKTEYSEKDNLEK